MADAVTTQVIHDGARNAVIKLTNLSDGTGEAAVLKVDVSTLFGTPTGVRIKKIHYDVSGMVVTLLWDATSDVRIIDLGSNCGEMDYSDFGGLTNNSGAGKTGDILLTTTGHTLADSYTLILELTKTF
jgi:hypothetical protein